MRKDLLNKESALTPSERKRLIAANSTTGKPAGYAAQPGTGPVGQTCRSCAHIVRKEMAKTYLKCGLMRAQWTGGTKTDIRANSPACSKWQGS